MIVQVFKQMSDVYADGERLCTGGALLSTAAVAERRYRDGLHRAFRERSAARFV